MVGWGVAINIFHCRMWGKIRLGSFSHTLDHKWTIGSSYLTSSVTTRILTHSLKQFRICFQYRRDIRIRTVKSESFDEKIVKTICDVFQSFFKVQFYVSNSPVDIGHRRDGLRFGQDTWDGGKDTAEFGGGQDTAESEPKTGKASDNSIRDNQVKFVTKK